MPPFALIWRDPALRMVSVLMVLQGALMSTFGPFVSVLAVRAFGLGDAGYAGVMVVSTLVSVAAALYSGIRADQTANRREIALFSGAVTVVGVAVMTFLPSTVSFILAHALLLPANSLFGQLFAQARLATATLPRAARQRASHDPRPFGRALSGDLATLVGCHGAGRADDDDLSGGLGDRRGNAGRDLDALA